MLYGLLLTMYFVVCLFLILIVLIQKGKSSMGIGSIGGGSQLIFGGSGGQDVFQKITWVLGALFMAGSLILALMKSRTYQELSIMKSQVVAESSSTSSQE
jgi:preprotein translocase subunit SecG